MKHYTEALARGPPNVNPDAHKLFSNRAACYTKLGAWDAGLKDADQCIAIKPDFVKAYVRKVSLDHCACAFAFVDSTTSKAYLVNQSSLHGRMGVAWQTVYLVQIECTSPSWKTVQDCMGQLFLSVTVWHGQLLRHLTRVELVVYRHSHWSCASNQPITECMRLCVQGHLQFFMKEHDEALKTYEQGLTYDKDNQELKEGLFRCQQAINKVSGVAKQCLSEPWQD